MRAAGTGRIAVVTGAGGGMGQVCASRLADRYALVLSEFREAPLSAIVQRLTSEGGEVIAAIPGDLGSTQVLEPLLAACGDRLGAVVHTAGHSPNTGDWRAILETNVVATARLLDALEPQVGPGLVVVLIASMARLNVPEPSAELLAVLEQPLAPDFAERMGALLPEEETARRGAAYCWSKWWVAREVQRRAPAWGPRGARIMSISPGMIHTPMGIAAVEDGQARVLLEGTPMRRWGTPADIANTVEFVLSDKATFLTGSDILVDGGMGAGIREMMGG